MTTPDPDNDRPRDGAGRFLRTLDSVEKDTQAARLRAQGATFDEIAEQLKFADRGDAHRAVSRALQAVPVQAAGELRELESQKLDELARFAWQILTTEHPLVSPGGKVVKDDDGAVIIDPGPILGAIDRLLKIAERRAKLLGLDQPARSSVEVSVTPETAVEVINSEIARLCAEIAACDRRELPAAHPEHLGEFPG